MMPFKNPVFKGADSGKTSARFEADGLFYVPKTRDSSRSNFDDKSRLIVLMDIDMTMIKTIFFETQAEADTYALSLPKDRHGRTVEYVTATDQMYRGIYHINIRPGLQKFIQEVADIADLHIFTAGSQNYAESVAQLLDPNGWYFTPEKIWSSTGSGGYVRFDAFGRHFKRLSALPLGREDLSRVVLIDDNPDNHKYNGGNMYCIREFTNQPDDCELEPALQFLQKELKDGDVRPVLAEREKETMDVMAWLLSVL
jgi:TFIIF-interacting CTD phosphatase-like protein